MPKIPICNDWSKSIPRQPDGHAVYLPCTGGVRCVEREKNVWHIEPIFDGSGPSARGFMTKDQLRSFLHQNGLRPIAFHHIGWYRGDYHAKWAPIVPGRTSHVQGAADMWEHISANMSGSRTSPALDATIDPTPQKLASLLDADDDTERLAGSISLSLRNMDIALEQVTEFYNENLTGMMAQKNLSGNRVKSSLDDTLYAQVHSFFMHLGAARDYLGALIAVRIGRDANNFDSMAKLIKLVRTTDFSSDALLTLLHVKGCLQHKPLTLDKVQAAGWLEDVTDLRNQFMHRRPYGAKFVEQMGYAKVIDENAGLYRYVRPILRPDGSEHDVLDLMAYHYVTASALFLECAEQSCYDTEMITLTDRDIISFSIDEI